ncbi:hypothetical protein ES677_10570 [Bizionia gelidisalsuginis]|uniref:Uncharacterized protein n=1 Tax=Bizionia gelidisalsuginis TaxID=291188 RepID=A0ABY3M906_9FLAO|nr:hypothetical protein [Bizionia gelidisalsuginis]TYC10754.1 hypothetical protein ES677_10570 [Bizionia gelidisalsuginis]
MKTTFEDSDMNTIMEGAENAIAEFFNSTQRKELNYNDLKQDISSILGNPKDSLDIIKARLSKMDSNTIKALVTNNKHIDES